MDHQCHLCCSAQSRYVAKCPLRDPSNHAPALYELSPGLMSWTDMSPNTCLRQDADLLLTVLVVRPTTGMINAACRIHIVRFYLMSCFQTRVIFGGGLPEPSFEVI